MPNRSLAAKAERAAKQRREAAHNEYTKPLWLGGTSKAELRAMLARFTGSAPVSVRVLPPGNYTAPEGKGHRRAHRTCYGDGTRRIGLPMVTLAADASRLRRAG